MINFLLNLGCNVSGCLSIQNERACFPNSQGILVYRFVTSYGYECVGINFSGIEF